MFIERVTLRQLPFPYEKRGRYTNGEVDPDIVVMATEIVAGGQRGIGECVPTSVIYPPGHIGRSSLDEWQVLQDLSRELLGKDVRQLGQLIPQRLRIIDANSLVDSVDFALHDLLGRLVGLPVWALLGGKQRPSVWGMPVIKAEAPEAMAEAAADEFAFGGYRWFKLKPHGVLELDREATVRIRERTHPQVQFFIDPNYALKMDLDGVVHYLNALHPLGLHVCEDPIDVELDQYRLLQQRTPVRIMLDEKARDPASVQKIIDAQAAKVINIHANWAGGFRSAMRKADMAALAGMDVIIGSTCYLGFGNAAYQTLACCMSGGGFCEQTVADGSKRRLIARNQYPTVQGRITPNDGPGLGIDADQAALDELALQTVTIS